MRPFAAVRFTMLTGIALAVAVAAGARGTLWLQGATGAGDWVSHFLLGPAAAVVMVAHRQLRRRAPGASAQSRVAMLATSMVAAAVLLAGALSRGTFWWRDALRLSQTGGLLMALLLLLGWCAAVIASERHVEREELPVESPDRAV